MMALAPSKGTTSKHIVMKQHIFPMVVSFALDVWVLETLGLLVGVLILQLNVFC